MKIIIVILALLSVSCGSGSTSEPTQSPPKKPETLITEFPVTSTWYELPQYFNDVPKYSGFFGTSTMKHIPSAVSCGLGNWAVYSNIDEKLINHALNLDTGVSRPIRKMNIPDPHQNAAIQCINNELIVYISARNTKQSGYVYTSKNGEDWQLQEETMKAYPQLHNVNERLIHFYTLYEGNTRYIYSSCDDKRIHERENTGSYMLSYYDGSYLHVVYNLHPDGNVDKRQKLIHRKSKNGCDWSGENYWYDGDKNVYLKDLNEVDGRITSLVTLSDSADPTEGERSVYKITSESLEKLFDINHNYTSGSLLESGEVVFPKGNEPYAGGSYLSSPSVNYIRRVENNPNLFVASEGISAKYKSDAWIIMIEIPEVVNE